MSDLLGLTFGKTASLKGNARDSGYERATADWYVEPPWAVEALLKVEKFDGPIWDPACGGGNILHVCRANGLEAFGSDIVQRGPAMLINDFLELTDISADSIITNPPFHLATHFAIHAMKLVTGKVAILQQLSWLEGVRRHRDLFALGHLARVWQFRRRVSMPPGGSEIEAKGGSKAFAWFVFDPSHKSQTWAGGWLP